MKLITITFLVSNAFFQSAFAQSVTSSFELAFSSGYTDFLFNEIDPANAAGLDLCEQQFTSARKAIDLAATSLGYPGVATLIEIRSNPSNTEKWTGLLSGSVYAGTCFTKIVSSNLSVAFTTKTIERRAVNGSVQECEKVSDEMRLTSGYIYGTTQGPYYKETKRYCSATGHFLSVSKDLTKQSSNGFNIERW